jgi:hypothetical protein
MDRKITEKREKKRFERVKNDVREEKQNKK